MNSLSSVQISFPSLGPVKLPCGSRKPRGGRPRPSFQWRCNATGKLRFFNKNVALKTYKGKGTVDHVPVYPREVAKRALELNASALILVHNHPSGDPTPSTSDIDMTAQIQSACDALGLTLHDHLIIGKSRELSFKTEGYL